MFLLVSFVTSIFNDLVVSCSNQIDSYKFHQELEGLQIEELFILIDVVNIFVAMASISQTKLFGIYWDQNDLLLLVLSLTGILDL